MSRQVRTALAIGWVVVALSGCEGPTDPYRNLTAGDLDTVAILPAGVYELGVSPDSTLFASGFNGALYRSAPGGGAPWTEIVAPGPDGSIYDYHRSLFARSRTEAYLYAGGGIARWTEGDTVRPEPTEVSGPIGCGDFVSGPRLWSIIDAGPAGLVAVGDHGLVLRREAAGWTAEPNELSRTSPSLCYQSFGTGLAHVGTDGERVYAGALALVESEAPGNWTRIPTPRDETDSTPSLLGIVSGPEPIFAFGYYGNEDGQRVARPFRFFRRDPAGRWIQIASLRAGTIPGFQPGAMQPGGPGLFWEWGGEVLRIRGGQLELMYLEPLRGLRGVAAVGDQIFAASMDSWTRSIIVRIRP